MLVSSITAMSLRVNDSFILEKNNNKLQSLKILAFKKVLKLSLSSSAKKAYILERLPADLVKLFLSIIALKTGRYENAQELISAVKADVKPVGNSLFSKIKNWELRRTIAGPKTLSDILVTSSFFGDFDVLKNLIALNMNINSLGNIYTEKGICTNCKLNALMVACYNGDQYLIENYLLASDIEVNAVDKNGFSPLMYCLFGYYDLSRKFKSKKYFIRRAFSFMDILGKLPLLNGSNRQQEYSVDLFRALVSDLIDKSAKFDIEGNVFYSSREFLKVAPLLIMSIYGDYVNIQFFLEKYSKNNFKFNQKNIAQYLLSILLRKNEKIPDYIYKDAQQTKAVLDKFFPN